MRKLTVLFATLVVIAALLVPVQAVFAAPDRPTRDTTNLEILLQRERRALENQQHRLDLSERAVQRVQTFIEHRQAAGKDVTSLVTALDAFQQAVSQTQTYHDSAAAVLSTPAGFDANGQVSDARQARQTLRDAGQALRQGHLVITQATIELRKVMRAYAETLKRP